MPNTHMASSRTKKHILNSYSYLLIKKDFQKITISDILTEANISKGTFYKYFQDKYDLSLQAYKAFFNNIKENVLSKNPFAQTYEYAQFINEYKIFYTALMKIDDGVLCFKEMFRDDLKKFYFENIQKVDIEADIYANQLSWMFSYLSSLNRKIEVEDIKQYQTVTENFSVHLKSAI